MLNTHHQVLKEKNPEVKVEIEVRNTRAQPKRQLKIINFY